MNVRSVLWWSAKVAGGAFLVALGPALLSVSTLFNLPIRLVISAVCVIAGATILVTNAIKRYQPDETSDPSARQLQQKVSKKDYKKFEHDEELATSVTALKDNRVKKYRIAGQAISIETVARLALFLQDSRKFHGRIVEEITPKRTNLRRKITSSLILNFPGTAALDAPLDQVNGDRGLILYPLATLSKGQLTDNFHVNLKGEETAVTLTYEEYCQTMVVLVQTFVRFSINHLTETAGGAEFIDRLDSLSWEGLSVICRRHVLTDDYAHMIKRAESVKKRLRELAKEVRSANVPHGVEVADFIKQIAQYSVNFAGKYPLLLVIPTECVKNNRCIVRYEQDSPPAWCYKHKPRQRRSFYLERLGALLGGQAGKLDVDLERAKDAQSFHIIFHGGDDTYLANQQIIGAGNYKMRGHGASGLPGRFTRPMGQSYFHGYFRDLQRRKKSSSSTLKVRLTFYEIPPGSIGKATISALAALALTTVVGILIPPFPPPSGSGALTSFSALVLAVPGAAAAWVGLDRPAGESILGTEITARISAFTTFVLSMSACGLFLTGNQHGALVHTPGFSILGLDDWVWVMLISAMFFVATFSAVSWIGRNARYLAVARRSQEDVRTDIRLKELDVIED